jgi:2-polyprenyl-3-methyl-5-hydroxy-6-metoxy-1,4-benzoquinol methylase
MRQTKQLELAQQLEAAQQKIAAMESSKFWKLRNAWIKFKKFLKLEPNELDNALTGTDYIEIPNSETYNDTTPVQIGTINEQPRNQWIEQQLRGLPAGLRILDAGCGEQQHRKFCQHLNYVGQDFDSYHGEGDLKGLQMGDWDQSNIDIISDIVAIPEPDQSFDIILCSEVFEHLPDPLAALKEFERLLVSGGKLILTAPFCSLTHFSPYHFYSGFNQYFYETNLKRYGFEILKIETNGNFFEYVAQELRRVNYVAQRYANYEFSELDHNTIYQSLSLLELINQSQNNSEELLCFGYHVLAEKRSVK